MSKRRKKPKPDPMAEYDRAITDGRFVDARRIALAMSEQRVRREDEAWRKAANEETATLAEGRGEDVERDERGGLRIKSRDGWMSLYRLGRIDQVTYDHGMTFRRKWERRNDGLGSQLGKIGQVGGGAGDPVFAGLTRALLTASLSKIQVDVAYDPKAGPLGWEALWQVVGEGRSLRETERGSRGFERRLAALIRAVEIAAK